MGIWNNDKVKITPEGGIAVQYINQTGEVSVKGTTVHITGPMTVGKTAINQPDCIGVIYNAGIPVGQGVWVVVSGVAQVLFSTATTAGYLARTFVTADGGAFVAGQALAEAVPSSPFASDKHFAEIGHVAETIAAPGLAKVNLHFN
jgi:hypothetical protein